MGGVLFRGRGIAGVRSCCHRPCPWWRGFQRQAGLPVHWPYSTKKKRMNGSVEKIECFFAEAQKSPDNRRACRQGGDGGIGVKIRLESMQSGLGVVPIVVLVGRLHDIISVPFALSLPLGYTNGYRTIWGIISQVSLGRVPLTWCPICYCHKGNRHARQVLRQCTQCRLSKCSLGEIWKIGPYSLLT
jgi:hypothetical protein